MTAKRKSRGMVAAAWLAILLALGLATAAPGVGQIKAAPGGKSIQPSDGIVIDNNSPLLDTFPGANYSLRFTTHGNSTPPLHWRLQQGTLPPGLKLEEDGLLHGSPERAGEFRFVISVADRSSPAQAVQKEFVLRVVEAITLIWKNNARVNGSRIEGSVEVSNTTADDMDLTFVATAVAENGRATAIGYQHFVLAGRGTTKELPFGETLPHGGYVVHVDAVGEVAKFNKIYRQRMQTAALQVTVGP